jgi:hypothetical protein
VDEAGRRRNAVAAHLAGNRLADAGTTRSGATEPAVSTAASWRFSRSSDKRDSGPSPGGAEPASRDPGALPGLPVPPIAKQQSDTAPALQRNAQQTNSVFRDRLLRLTVLKGTKNVNSHGAAGFQRRRGTKRRGLRLAMWQIANAAVPQALAAQACP